MAKDLLSMNRQFTNGQTSQRQHHLARDFFGAHLVTPFGTYLVRRLLLGLSTPITPFFSTSPTIMLLCLDTARLCLEGLW